MTMAYTEPPKLIRRPTKARLHKAASRASLGDKMKPHDVPPHRHKEHGPGDSDNAQNHSRPDNSHSSDTTTTAAVADSERRSHVERVKERDKKTKKARKKEKDKPEVWVERKITGNRNSFWSRREGALAKRESFQQFVFDKVRAALDIAYKNGVSYVDVDNVAPLLKSLDIAAAGEDFIDLIRNSIIENRCEVSPLTLDALVMKIQADNQLVDMDECLEAAFNLVDFDEDGYLTHPDIQQLMLQLLPPEDLTDSQLHQMLMAVDADKDGRISLSDFRHFLLSPHVPRETIAETQNGNNTESPERKNKEQNDKNNQEDAITDNRSQKAGTNTGRTIKKITSVTKGFKPTASTGIAAALPGGGLTAVDDMTSSGFVSIQEEEFGTEKSQDAECQGILSPRQLESVTRKKSFFGGFINNDRSFASCLGEFLNFGETGTTIGLESTGVGREENTPDAGSSLISVEGFQDENRTTYSHNGSSDDDNVSSSRENLRLASDNLPVGKPVQETICSRDTGSYKKNGAWEDDLIPSETGEQTVQLPEPGLYQIVTSDLNGEKMSTTLQQQQRQQHQQQRLEPQQQQQQRRQEQQQRPGHDATDHLGMLLHSQVVNARMFASTPRLARSGVHSKLAPAHTGRNTPDRACDSIKQDIRNFSNRLVFEPRNQRHHNNSSENLPATGNIEPDNENNEMFSSFDNDEMGLTDSDEGIEIVDGDLKFSPCPPPPPAPVKSLRIDLPRGDNSHNGSSLAGVKATAHKKRSHAIFDRDNVDDDDDTTDNMDLNPLNHNRTPDTSASLDISNWHTEDKHSKVNDNSSCSDSSGSVDRRVHGQNLSLKHKRLAERSTSSSSTFDSNKSASDSKNESVCGDSDESVCDDSDESIVLLNNNTREIHNWHATQDTDLAMNHPDRFTHEYFTLKLLGNPRLPLSQQRSQEPLHETKLNVNHDTGEPGIFHDSADLTSHLRISPVTDSDGCQLPVPEEEKVSGGYRHQPVYGWFPPRAQVEKMNLNLHWDKSRSVQTKNMVERQVEPNRHRKRFPHQHQTTTDKGQPVVGLEYSVKVITHRKLERARTSFDLPTARRSEVEVMSQFPELPTGQQRKRSLSATTSRRVKTASSTTKPPYTPISVLDLTQCLQTGVRNHPPAKGHFLMSNIVPLSRMLEANQSNRHRYGGRYDYSIPRNTDKSGVPYFLHSSSSSRVFTSSTKSKRRAQSPNRRPYNSFMTTPPDGQHDKYNNDVTGRPNRRDTYNNDGTGCPDRQRQPNTNDVTGLPNRKRDTYNSDLTGRPNRRDSYSNDVIGRPNRCDPYSNDVTGRRNRQRDPYNNRVNMPVEDVEDPDMTPAAVVFDRFHTFSNYCYQRPQL